MLALVRTVIGLLNGAPDVAIPENLDIRLRTTGWGALWTRLAIAGVTSDIPVDATHGVPVVDQGLLLVGAGNLTLVAVSTAAAPAMTGAGYLTIKNTEIAGGITMYLSTGTADATKFPLIAGDSITLRIADVTTLNIFGTGGKLGWLFTR